MNTSGITSPESDESGNLPEGAATDQQGGLVDADSRAQFNAAVEQRLTDGQDSDSSTSAQTQTETEDDKTDLPVLEEEEDSPVKPQNS